MEHKGETLGERIKRIRGTIHQVEFGKRLGVSQGTVSAWERDDEDRLPSADIYFRLASVATDPKDQVFFMQAAGLSREVIFAAANQIASEQIVRPKDGEMITVPRFEKHPPKEGDAHVAALPFPPHLIPGPLITQYFIVDKYSSGYGLEEGDYLILDVSQAGEADPAVFYEKLVLIEHFNPYWETVEEREHKEQFIGRVFLREQKMTDRVYYSAMIQPCSHFAYDRGEGRGREPSSYKRGDRHQDAGPFILGTWYQITDDRPRTIQHRFERKKENGFIGAGYRVLGILTGWIRPPKG